MALSALQHPSGILPRTTGASDALGQKKLGSYISSAGVETGEPQTLTRIYNNSGGATVDGGVYAIAYSGDESKWLQVIDVAAAGFDQEYAVSIGVIEADAVGWFCTAGFCNALVDGDSANVADGDYLKMTAATNADAFIVEGTPTTFTTDTIAVACGANTSTEALVKVLLLGGPHDND
jgi:hypothetical protein